MLENEPSFIHRKQLLQYMSILGVNKGIILYIFLDNKIDDPFREQLVTFEYENQPADILEELERDAIELARGVKEPDPSLVKHIANNINFLGRNGVPWICRYCDFKEQCDSMRRADGEEVIDEEPKVKRRAKSIERLITEIKLRDDNVN